MNSAIPSEGSIRANSPALRNPYCANPVLRVTAINMANQQPHQHGNQHQQSLYKPPGQNHPKTAEPQSLQIGHTYPKIAL